MALTSKSLHSTLYSLMLCEGDKLSTSDSVCSLEKKDACFPPIGSHLYIVERKACLLDLDMVRDH